MAYLDECRVAVRLLQETHRYVMSVRCRYLHDPILGHSERSEFVAKLQKLRFGQISGENRILLMDQIAGQHFSILLGSPRWNIVANKHIHELFSPLHFSPVRAVIRNPKKMALNREGLSPDQRFE